MYDLKKVNFFHNFSAISPTSYQQAFQIVAKTVLLNFYSFEEYSFREHFSLRDPRPAKILDEEHQPTPYLMIQLRVRLLVAVS